MDDHQLRQEFNIATLRTTSLDDGQARRVVRRVNRLRVDVSVNAGEPLVAVVERGARGENGVLEHVDLLLRVVGVVGVVVVAARRRANVVGEDVPDGDLPVLFEIDRLAFAHGSVVDGQTNDEERRCFVVVVRLLLIMLLTVVIIVFFCIISRNNMLQDLGRVIFERGDVRRVRIEDDGTEEFVGFTKSFLATFIKLFGENQIAIIIIRVLSVIVILMMMIEHKLKFGLREKWMLRIFLIPSCSASVVEEFFAKSNELIFACCKLKKRR